MHKEIIEEMYDRLVSRLNGLDKNEKIGELIGFLNENAGVMMYLPHGVMDDIVRRALQNARPYEPLSSRNFLVDRRGLVSGSEP